MTSLDQAIEDFYQAFSGVPAPACVAACPCCLSAKQVKQILKTPLREQSGDTFGHYASAAFLTVGGIPDYLYFLPRILDITIHDGGWWPSIEVTARSIVNSGLHSWPPERRGSLDRLLRAVVQNLTDNGPYDEIDDWMCAIGKMDLDVRPYLHIIETNPDAVLDFWKYNSRELDLGHLGNAFWEGKENKQYDAIVDWFNSPKINLMCVEALN